MNIDLVCTYLDCEGNAVEVFFLRTTNTDSLNYTNKLKHFSIT